MTTGYFHPNNSASRWWRYSEQTTRIIELQDDEDDWDEDDILQRVRDTDVDKMIVFRIILSPILSIETVAEAVHTIRRARIMDPARILILDLLDCHFSYRNEFQECLDLMAAIGDGIFQRVCILQIGLAAVFPFRETTARALGSAMNINALTHLHVSEVDMKTSTHNQSLFFDGLRNCQTITDISFGCFRIEFNAFYDAVKANLSLERIVILDHTVITNNLERFGELLHHCDLNSCGQAFLKPQTNNTHDGSDPVEVPLKLWPLIVARIGDRLARNQVYTETVIPNLDVRQARIIFEFVKNCLVPQLVLRTGFCEQEKNPNM